MTCKLKYCRLLEYGLQLAFNTSACINVTKEASDEFGKHLDSPLLFPLFGKTKNGNIGSVLKLHLPEGINYLTQSLNIIVIGTLREAYRYVGFEGNQLNSSGTFVCSFFFCLDNLSINDTLIATILEKGIIFGRENRSINYFVFQHGKSIFVASHSGKIMYMVSTETGLSSRIEYFDPLDTSNFERYDVDVVESNIACEVNEENMHENIIQENKTLSSSIKKYSVTIFDKDDDVVDAFCCEGSLDIVFSKCMQRGAGTLTINSNSKIITYKLL